MTFFLAYYRIHKLDHTYLYPGVLQSLTAIRRTHPHLPMAVLTNKPVAPSRVICKHFTLDRFFFEILGGNSFATKKPHPEGLLSLITQASALTGRPISPSRTVLIGDSHTDVETARAAGAFALGCTYGLSPESLAASRPDATVNQAADWPSALHLGTPYFRNPSAATID